MILHIPGENNRDKLNRHFESYIRKTFAGKEELSSFFLNHENRPRMIRNVLEQIAMIEMRVNKFSAKQFYDLANDMTKTFCLIALDLKEKEVKGAKTDLAKFDKVFTKKMTMEEPELPDGVISVDRK